MENWVEIYSSQDLIEAEIVKQKVQKEGIPVRLINKQDSNYINFGAIHLYVDRDHVIKAKHIISKTNTSDE